MVNPLVHFLVAFDLGAILLYMFAFRRLSLRWFQAGAVVLIAFDLFLVSGSAINPVAPASYLDKRPSTAFLQENLGLYRVYQTNQNGDPNLNLGHYFPMIYRIPSFGGSSSLTVRWAQEYRDAVRANPHLYDLAGVKYVLEEGEEAPEGFSGPLREVFSTPEIHIWENPNVMPRAFIVHEAVLDATEADLPTRLEDPSFPFERVALLDDPSAAGLLDAPSTPSVTGSAEITHYSYQDVVVECETDEPGFLILTDSYYPGWRAEVDGRPEPIYRADGMFRAVFLEPGRHSVTFHFAQPIFWWGVAIAAFTAAVLAGVGVLGLLKIRRGA
jgi:hypothetical protein